MKCDAVQVSRGSALLRCRGEILAKEEDVSSARTIAAISEPARRAHIAVCFT